MYTLRGTDHQEHGPITARDVREWIASGRATRNTEVRGDNETIWRPLSQFVEFGPALQIAEAASAPPDLPQQKPNRIMAICAFVLSFIPLLTTLPALVLGILALVFARKNPRRFGGKRLAIAALVICVLWIVGIPTALYSAFIHQRRVMMTGRNCYMHAMSLANSLQVIAVANQGGYPDADSWCDAIRKEVTSTNHFQCPDDPKHGICGFTFNEKLSGAKHPDPRTVAVFESDLGWNTGGGVSNAVARHNGRVMVGFVNGNVRGVRISELKSLRWDP
jgi:hypothetical protein